MSRLTATDGELDRLVKQTPPGCMMHWAGTSADPAATCGECQHYGYAAAICSKAGDAVGARRSRPVRALLELHRPARRQTPSANTRLQVLQYTKPDAVTEKETEDEKVRSVPSKSKRSSDLKGKAITVIIHRTTRETLKSPEGKVAEKTVLYFVGAKKGLPLNLTNWDSVAEICGEDSDDWLEQKVELYPTKVQMGGKMVDAIRIRPPAQGELKRRGGPTPERPSVADEMEDEIPF